MDHDKRRLRRTTFRFLDAFAEDKLLPVVQLDNGFMRPTYESQVQMSYQQAGLVCLFAEQRWGFPNSNGG